MAETNHIPGLAAELIAEHAASLQPNGHHGHVARYLNGKHDMPILPEDAERRRTYEGLAQRSITNLLPRVSDTFVKLLTVDGIRTQKKVRNEPVWKYWQANKLDARQTIAHRGAVEYGASYVVVLPGKPTPAIQALDPLRSSAWYEDQDDEWPIYGIRHRGQVRVSRDETAEKWELYDNKSVHTLIVPSDGGKIRLHGPSLDHNLGVTPFVRFRDRLDGTPTGVISPLITPQNRINDTVFALNIAMFFASFRQRWGKGLEIPVDERLTIPNPDFNPELPEDPETNPTTIPNPMHGEPIAEFDYAIDRLWVTASKDAQFGEFNQTLVDGHLLAIHQAMDTMTTLGQMPAGMLKGDLVNTGADALATLYDITTRQAKVYQLLFGEAWEQAFRLAALADGRRIPDDAEIRWRDPEARAFASTVDALGKMVQMLNVPYEAAWEMIPGRTEGDFQRWRAMLETQRAQEAAQAQPTILDDVVPAPDKPETAPAE